MLDDKQHQKKEVFRLFGKHADGRLTRRQLLGELGKLGLGAAAVAWLAGHSPIAVRQALAAGATAEERALTAAAELAKTAVKKTISILHPSGSAGNMRPLHPGMEGCDRHRHRADRSTSDGNARPRHAGGGCPLGAL
jgi:hypothetical protein